MVLNTFKTGFFSHSSEVVQLCLRVMQKFGKSLIDGNQSKPTYDWFANIQSDGGITSALYVLKKHQELVDFVVNVMCVFSKGRLTYVFRDLLKSLYPAPLEYTSIINDFIYIIVKNEPAVQEILEHGLIDQWLEIVVKQADNDGKHSSEERTAAMALISDLWVLFPEKLKLREDLATQILTVMKRCSKDKNRPLRISTLAQMFRLLNIFSETKNPQAATLYKNISHSLVDNHHEATTREYIMANLLGIYQKHPSIPVSFVIEPLIKQLQMSENDTYVYGCIDFDFFSKIASHPKLVPTHALYILDTMAKMYLNDMVYANAAAQPFIRVAQRFMAHD